MSRQDARLIGALWFDAYTNHRRPPESDLRPNARSLLENWIRERTRERTDFGYVAEIDGVLAGFLLGRVGTWPSEPPILKPRKLAMIDTVFVIERFRMSGVATALVGRAVDHARASGAVGIEATFEDGNPSAAALWKRFGFVPTLSRAYRSLRL